jgi:hypothetical protein
MWRHRKADERPKDGRRIPVPAHPQLASGTITPGKPGEASVPIAMAASSWEAGNAPSATVQASTRSIPRRKMSVLQRHGCVRPAAELTVRPVTTRIAAPMPDHLDHSLNLTKLAV